MSLAINFNGHSLVVIALMSGRILWYRFFIEDSELVGTIDDQHPRLLLLQQYSKSLRHSQGFFLDKGSCK
jgi:hypothetical protein